MGSRVATSLQLQSINGRSVKADLNRTLSEHLIENLDPEGIHVEFFSMIHNDDHYRLGLLVKLKGQIDPAEVFLDMSFEDYKTLGQAIYDDDGNLVKLVDAKGERIQ